MIEELHKWISLWTKNAENSVYMAYFFVHSLASWLYLSLTR